MDDYYMTMCDLESEEKSLDIFDTWLNYDYQFSTQDRIIHKGGTDLVNAQNRVKNLTMDILKSMTKEQLLMIIADMNSENYYHNSGKQSIAEFMFEFKANIELIEEEANKYDEF